MTHWAYYNENDPYCAAWLTRLVASGLLPDGDVDPRSIKDVQPDELTEYTQLHFFAGLGGWAYALRLAGWPADRPIVTGSCPCQPFSVAGKGAGAADPRHLWPDFHRILRGLRPPVVVGEQVAGSAGYGWFDGVQSDLEAEGYACRAVDIPACSVNAPHIRNRLYWVSDGLGHPGSARLPLPEHEELCRTGRREEGRAAAEPGGATRGMVHPGQADREGFWDDCTLVGPDPAGKYRRVKPGVRLLAHGIPARVAKLRALGNAIVPQEAAEVIRAYMEDAPQ